MMKKRANFRQILTSCTHLKHLLHDESIPVGTITHVFEQVADDNTGFKAQKRTGLLRLLNKLFCIKINTKVNKTFNRIPKTESIFYAKSFIFNHQVESL